MRNLKFILLIIFFASFLFLCKVLFLGYYPDFSDYYFGPKVMLSGANPYLATKNFFTPYVYPPFVLFFFTPLLILPFQVAEIIWTGSSIILLFSSIVLFLKMYRQKLFSISSLIILILTCWYFPVKFSLGMGQLNIAILFLITIGTYLYHQNRKNISGVVFALPILLKFFPLLLVIFLGIKRKWKLLSILLTTVLIGGVGSLFLLNSSNSSYFINHVFLGYFSGWKGDYYNQSFSGVLMRAGVLTKVGEVIRGVFTILGIGITLLVIFWANVNKKKSIHLMNVSIGALITISLLVNNFSWQHHFVWLIFPLIATFFAISSIKNKRKYYILLGIVYLLTALNIKSPQSIPTLLQSHVFFGAFLLWIMDLYFLMKNRV